MARLVLVASLLAGLALVQAPSLAQEKPGRFTMTPADGGFMRLDTETGALSFCKRRGEQWACEPANDTARDEAAKLRAENKNLQGEVRRMEEMIVGDGKSAPAPKSAPQVQLPSEQEIDRAIDELERLFKKYRDRLKEFDRSIATSPPPPPPPPAPPKQQLPIAPSVPEPKAL